MKNGYTFLYQQHFIRLARWIMSKGHTKSDISQHSGISRPTLDKLLREKDPA